MTPAPASVTVRAVSLPAPLVDLRRTTSGGSILAMFDRSAYLDLDGRIIALASADLAQGPLTITVEDYAPLRAIPIGTDVTLTGGDLRLGAIAVELHAARLWDPSLAADGDTTFGPAPAARDAAIDELLAGVPDGSIAPLLRSKPLASPGTAIHAELLEALGRGLGAIADLLSGRQRPDAVAEIIGREVAGRGPGLTPSGDDLLIGILYALVVWPGLSPFGKASRARNLLVEAARQRTTRISGAYLKAARRGWAAEPWHALVRSFSESPASTRAAVRRLLRIGETSGTDALTGFCWAWRRVSA